MNSFMVGEQSRAFVASKEEVGLPKAPCSLLHSEAVGAQDSGNLRTLKMSSSRPKDALA